MFNISLRSTKNGNRFQQWTKEKSLSKEFTQYQPFSNNDKEKEKCIPFNRSKSATPFSQGNQLTNRGRDSGSRVAIHYTGDTRKIHKLRGDPSNPWFVYARRSVVETGFFLSAAIYNVVENPWNPFRATAGEYINRCVADKRRGSSATRSPSNIPITESPAIKSLDRIIQLGFVSINSYNRTPTAAIERLPYPSQREVLISLSSLRI